MLCNAEQPIQVMSDRSRSRPDNAKTMTGWSSTLLTGKDCKVMGPHEVAAEGYTCKVVFCGARLEFMKPPRPRRYSV
jgi:hypothetical protein